MKKKIQDDLGKRMCRIRLEKGYKQAEVAEALHVSRSTYSYYETGAARPDPAVLGKLAHLYHVPVSAFFEEGCSVKDQPFLQIGFLSPEERALIRLLRTSGIRTVPDLFSLLEETIQVLAGTERLEETGGSDDETV